MSARPQQQNDRLKDYVPVAERIEAFYKEYPQGRINTHIVEHDAERGFILMRAEVYRNPDDAMPSATGHAYEIRGEGHVNKTSYIENCETGCVGRALAMCGFEVKRGIASREEMEKVQRHQSTKPAPVADSEFSESGAWKAGDQARDGVLSAETGATQRTGLQRRELRDWVEARHKTRAVWTLDVEILRDYRDYLKGLK